MLSIGQQDFQGDLFFRGKGTDELQEMGVDAIL